LELLYHVASDDSVFGSIERSKAHLDQILHWSGMIFLIRSDGKILLQRRSPSNATFPGCWDSSSSFHVTFGESYEQAARRELKEEAGVSAPSRTSESSHAISHPRTRSWRYSHVEVMTLSELIMRNRLKHRSTQETMST